MTSPSKYRVKRRGKQWGVQERGRWFWHWIGPYDSPALGLWDSSDGALWFANLCERIDARRAAKYDASRHADYHAGAA